MRIGMPQGLMHYQYGPIWQCFFELLGAEVVVSARTTRATLDAGSVLDEFCLPAKAYYGHVVQLQRQVDCLFVPRVVSICKGQYTCPKIIGMPDVLRANVRKLPPLIDAAIDLRPGSRALCQAVTGIGKAVGAGIIDTLQAWRTAWNKQSGHVVTLPPGRPAVALIGHPYLVHDHQLSLDVIAKIERLGFEVMTAELVTEQVVDEAAGVLNKKMFWSSSHRLAGAAYALMAGSVPVEGVVFMTCFACGPDALIGELIARQAHRVNIPYMQLSVDEHTAEAGFITRLEAFGDMLARRRRQ